MGFIIKTITILIPLSSMTIYSLHIYGPIMPKLCRITGNYLGLFFELFKYFL